MKPNETPHILWSSTTFIAFRPESGSAHMMQGAESGVKECMESSLRYISMARHEQSGKHLPKKIHEIQYVLSSPWIVSQARTVSFSFPAAKTVTDHLIRTLLASERAKTVSANTDLEVIEEKIFDVTLNGYQVHSWAGKETASLGVSHVIGLAGSKTVERLRNAALRLVPTKRIHFHSSLLLQHLAMREVMPNKKDYILAHIHGELTDIVAVKDRSCVFFGSYPFGIHSIIRHVAEAMKTDTHAADSFIGLYISHHLDAITERENAPAMEQATGVWIAGFTDLTTGIEGATTGNIIVSTRTHRGLFVDALTKSFPKASIIEEDRDDVAKLAVFGTSTESNPLISLYAHAIHTVSDL